MGLIRDNFYIKGLGYKGTMKILYVKNEFELSKLVEIKNDNDTLALVGIYLWRNIKVVYLYVLHWYDHGNGTFLI